MGSFRINEKNKSYMENCYIITSKTFSIAQVLPCVFDRFNTNSEQILHRIAIDHPINDLYCYIYNYANFQYLTNVKHPVTLSRLF